MPLTPEQTIEALFQLTDEETFTGAYKMERGQIVMVDGDLPSDSDLEAAYTRRINAQTAKDALDTALISGGITQLIASLGDPDPHRPLTPAKVRFGLGVLAALHVDPSIKVEISDADKAALISALAGLAAILTPPA